MTSFRKTSLATPRHSRFTLDYDEDDLTGPNFVDHFSLREPSSTVKFRGARVHIYETSNEQIILEDRVSSSDGNGKFFDDDDDDDDNGKSRPLRHNITVKRMPWSSFGLVVLRSSYALISLLLFGFAFAFSFQIILFLFVNLAADIGRTSASGEDWASFFKLMSTLLGVPVFLFGFSSLMAMITTFVSEAWSGGQLIRAVIGAPTIVRELSYFVFFLLVPAITLIGALYAQTDMPFETACYAWLGSVLFVFIWFALAIVWCEVATCFRLLAIHYGEDSNGGEVSFFEKVRRSLLLVQNAKYAGIKNEQYVVTGEDIAPQGGYTFCDKHDPISARRSFYSRITQLGCLRFMFKIVDPPKRLYSVEEVRDVLPFLTAQTWSFETMFCSSSRSRKIITTSGPAALRPSQIITSTVCNSVLSLVIISMAVSYLVWMDTGITSYLVVGILLIICFLLPLIKMNWATLKMYRDANNKDEEKIYEKTSGGDADGDDGVEEQRIRNDEGVTEKTVMFRLWETSRVTKPKNWVCYAGLILEFTFLFLLPIIALFYAGNFPYGIVFFVLAFFSFLRKYFDAATILCELGSMSTINIEREPGNPRKHGFLPRRETFKGAEKTLALKARLSDIVGYVSRSGAVTRWMYFFGVLAFGFFFLFSVATTDDDGLGERPPIVLVDDFAYVAEKSLQYPTCQMDKGFTISVNGTDIDSSLGDYAFLSALAYETTSVTDYILSQYFGEGVAVDEDELVSQYRAEAGNEGTPVYFKFFTFPSLPGAGVLSIRGSQTSWDWMVNMQLWSASGLAQMVKWMIPYGWIWTPILDDLVYFISMIQAEQLEEISYYRVTSAFVNKFKESYDGMRVTGASLGGGLAIITGAQTRTSAVAISGLGAEFSRNTLSPPISIDDINKYVFNFIPDRDYIARIGGRPRQHQEGQCTAPFSSLAGCHSMWRSICEIFYRCGSNGRPIPCRCHLGEFGYPEPEPIGNTTRSFRKACDEQEQTFMKETGSSRKSAWS